MSLDTVIKIGKLYRQSDNSWQFHDQVNWAMKDINNLSKKRDSNDKPIQTTFYELPVVENEMGFEFKIEEISEIHDEDKRNNIYYLNFKTSKKDAEKRYLIGDIVYSSFINKKGEVEENGNYRMPKEKKVSSFYRAEDVSKTMSNRFIQNFRNEFRAKSTFIEELLKKHPSIVLHFNFQGKRWIDFDGIVNSIDNILTEALVVNTEFEEKVALDKYLYKTLGGNSPGFLDTSRYKNRLFEKDEIISLMYAGKAAEKPTIRINSIGIIALPHSDKLSSKEVVAFFERNKTLIGDEKLIEEEHKEDLMTESENAESDSLFDEIVNNDFDNSVKFDIVFTSIPGSPAGVFYDLIEIPNIEKSLLVKVKNNIVKAKIDIQNQAEEEFPDGKFKPNLDVKNSFLKILGDVTKDKKKFQMHLLRTLPKIYSDTYYDDIVLLPAFIEKVEYNIRNNGQAFSTLKYDFYFLSKIQKNNTIMQITNSQSYAIGQALGKMARPFVAWRDDCPIKSFEKSYVGNLTRRISSLDDVTKFADFLNQKLTIHERAFKTEKDAFLSLVEIMKSFKERYNKHYCSLGFFESYYAPFIKENNPSNNKN